MNWWGHFHTITAHKFLVMKYCFKVGLYRQGLLHDLSKYGPTEFLVGVKYYQGNRSPNEIERLETGVSSAWLHHKAVSYTHLDVYKRQLQGDEKDFFLLLDDLHRDHGGKYLGTVSYTHLPKGRPK